MNRRTAPRALVAMTLLLGGCAGSGAELASGLSESRPAQNVAAATPAEPQGELEKATDYWGKKFVQTPNNLEYALNYAKNLKAMGRKQQALAALQHASTYHAQSRELASEYGRLALELDQVQTAKQLLAFADDPARPDWRIVSARGAALAKEGNHKDAIPLFQRAMALSNGNPSVMNNLAMAYALDGRAGESEQLLKEAAAKGGNAQVQKNLALVLGLQGKYDEAQVIGNRVLPHDTTKADTAIVRQMVRLDPKPYTPAAVAAPPTAVAKAPLPVAQAAVKTAATEPVLRTTVQAAPAAADWQTRVATAADER